MSVKNDKNPKFSVRPLTSFMYKMWLYIWIIGFIVIVSVYFFYFIISTSSSKFDPTNEWVVLFHLTFIPFVLVCMLLGHVIAYFYYKTMEFQIFDNEVVVRKGVVNKTEKHVPYRTVTNISTRYGVFDKLFGIGTVEIETAGKSGQSTGPEEKIEGIKNFVDMRDTILEELRKFRSQYTTTTEPALDASSADNYQASILNELRSIKSLLQNRQN